MKRFLFLCAASLLAAAACGQPSVRIAHGPYLQQVSEDGFTVVWTTTVDAAAWGEVAPDDGTHFYAEERPKYYDTHIGKRRTGQLHRVRVGGLRPGTTYRYRIMQQAVLRDEGNKRVILGEGYGSDILKHEPYRATTLDPSRERIECWVVNDIHGRDSILRQLLADAPEHRPDFVCFNGDMLTQIESVSELFDGYLDTAAELLSPAGIPIFATRGNHENRGSASHRYLDYFPTPTGEAYYAFRQGPVFFLMLDCGEDKPDSDIRYYGLAATDAYRAQEAEWLRQVVASDAYREAPLHVVFLHMVPGGKSSWHGEQEIRRLFVPILNEAEVDVMLCGHYHRYGWIDDGSRGTNFPILINSNRDKLVVKADRRGIDLEVIDPAGTTLKRHRIDSRSADTAPDRRP